MLTLVAFLFVGMNSAAAQSQSVSGLQAKVADISQSMEGMEDGTVKKTYYTDLITFYNAIIEDVEQNDVPFTRAVKTNFSLMPRGADNKVITSDIPREKISTTVTTNPLN